MLNSCNCNRCAAIVVVVSAVLVLAVLFRLVVFDVAVVVNTCDVLLIQRRTLCSNAMLGFNIF